MQMTIRRVRRFPLFVSFAVVLLLGGTTAVAQNSNFKMELHANKNARAAEIGLPAYPGAALDKGTDNSSAADLGFAYGDTHFRLVVAKYVTADSPERVLAFYRKPLSQYGDVLECNQGKPVGALSASHGGLTCSGQENGNATSTGNIDFSGHHDLRSGSPRRFRIVGIDESNSKSTRFALVYIELPKDKDQEGKSK